MKLAKPIDRIFRVFLSVVMAMTLTFPVGMTTAYASEGSSTLAAEEADPVVGSLKIIARFNDDMAFYDGHTYLSFTSYQDGVTFPCDESTNYATYTVDPSYYEDIASDLGNGSWRTGTDADQYFTLFDKSNLPGEMTVNRGQIITIGNYRAFDLSILDTALGAIENSTFWTTLSDNIKVAIVDEVTNLLSTQSTLSEAELMAAVESATGSTDTAFIAGLIDGVVEGGICYNRELYNQKLEYDQFENVTYQVDITQSQLDRLQEAMAQYNKFSLFNNSCATVAVGLWNIAMGDKYQLSANGSGVFSAIQEPKFVRQSIEANLPGYKTNMLDSVEETDAAATTDGVTYYVTAPAKVDTNYTPAASNVLSVDTANTPLDVLRYAGMPEETPTYTYPAGAVNYDVTIDATQSEKSGITQYAINSVAFSYDDQLISELSDYDGAVWFTAAVDKNSVVTDDAGNKLASYYDADEQLVHFKVDALPATVNVKAKADFEHSNLAVISDGTQDVYYYNGDQKVAVTDDMTLTEGTTVYVKPTGMTGKVLETITLNTPGTDSVDLKGSYSAEEGAYSFVMPGVNTEVDVHFEAVTITENDGHSVIQVKLGEAIDLSDYFTIETESASKDEMTLKYAADEQAADVIAVSEDGALEALAEGKTTVNVYVNDDIFTAVAIEVYDGDMVSITYDAADNGTFAIATDYDGTSSSCFYSGYLVKKGSKVTVTTMPDEGYVVSGAYYGRGLLKALTLHKITGSFTADKDLQIKVSFAKAEINNVPDYVSLNVEGTYQLEPSLAYTEESGSVFDGALTYVSSDETVAKVSEDGTITAVGDGVAVVIVRAAAGTGVTKQCEVNVGDVNGNEIVGRLTISARPIVENQLVAHAFVSFTSYEDGLTISNANYNCYYQYLQQYLDTINNAAEGVDGRLYNDSISTEERESYFAAYETAGSTELALDKGDVITLSAYSTASSNEQAIMDAFTKGDIASYPSFQEMLYYYTNLNTDADKVGLFDSTFATLKQLFTDIYVNDTNPVNGVTAGGININRELYNQFRRSDSMSPNNTYSVDITANELAHLKAYLADEENNYYALVTHNCATVAAEIWNETLYDQESLHVDDNYSKLGSEPESLYYSIGNLMGDAEVAGYGLTNFVPGPGKDKAIEDLAGYSTLTISDTENGTITVTDESGNDYQSGDQVKNGTTLTVSTTCDYGYLLDSLEVNDDSLTSTTFTMKEDATLTATFEKSTIILDKTELTLNVGGTDTLSPYVRHTADTAAAGLSDVVYESSDPSVVQVDQYGNIEALQAGVAKITVSAQYGNGVFERCYIIVQDEASQQDLVGKLMIVGRYSTEALFEDLNFGHGFFQFTSYEDNLSVDVSNMYWVYMPTDAFYEAVNTYDGVGADPVTYHNESTEADNLFTKVTDMSTIGNTYTVNKNEIFTMGSSTNYISSAQCAVEAILKGDVSDILIKHGKYAMINALFESMIKGEISFNSFKLSLIATLAEIGYDVETGFNPFNGVVDEGAAMINRELYRQADSYDQYPNATYEIEITRDQLEILMMYMNDHSYYSVLDNNCAGLIAKAWNVVTSGNESYKIDAGINGSLANPKTLKSEITRIAEGKAGYEADHEVFKPQKTNYVVYDESQYVVKDGDQVIKSYELVEPGTTLTVYCLNDKGEIDTTKSISSVTVNGKTIAGSTFTMGAIRANLTCESGNLMTVYRLYNGATGEHLWTTDAGEYQSLPAYGWTQEGTAWKSPSSGVGVYRLYNPELGTHHYTSDQNEIAVLSGSYGWNLDNNGQPLFYSVDASAPGAVAVYRLYNSGLSQHLLTMDTGEYQTLPAYGWDQEGVSFYAYK